MRQVANGLFAVDLPRELYDKHTDFMCAGSA